MASTNEDVTVLATAPLGDDRLLILRHLPDRGTVEIGWWAREEGGAILPGPSVLELAAEAVESVLSRACARSWLAQAGTRPARARASPRPLPLPMAPASRPCVPGTESCWSGILTAVTWSYCPRRRSACSSGCSRSCCSDSGRSASAWSSMPTRLPPGSRAAGPPWPMTDGPGDHPVEVELRSLPWAELEQHERTTIFRQSSHSGSAAAPITCLCR